MSSNYKIAEFDVDQLYLDFGNPRTGPVENLQEAIQKLCGDDKILNLASDIQRFGLNPIEAFALLPGKAETFTVAEGNRRLCAIMLTNDPDLAPTKYKKEFQQLSETGSMPSTVQGVVFPNRDEVNLWLLRLHTSKVEGVSRQRWNAEQIARFSNAKRYELSLQIIDYAIEQGITDSDAIENSLSIIQPYVDSAELQSLLGLTLNSKRQLQTNLSKPSFNALISLFLGDVKNKSITTRSHPRNIKRYEQYAAELLQRLESPPKWNASAKSLSKQINDAKKIRADQNLKSPYSPKPPKYFPSSLKITEKLDKLGNYKLQLLYKNLLQLNIPDNVVLASVGLWSFLESMTSLHGKRRQPPFPQYCQRFFDEFQLGPEAGSLNRILPRVADNGNSSKHDQISANFSDQQLINDFTALENLIESFLDSCIQQSSSSND